MKILLILFVLIGGVAFAQPLDPSDVLVQQLSMPVTNGNHVNSVALESGEDYYLRVYGTYGYANGNPWMDAAYCYQGPVNGCDPARPDTGGLDADWFWNGLRNQRPTPDEYNPSHIYYFLFQGNGQAQDFYFYEPHEWDFWDNVGQLDIEVYWSPADAGTVVCGNISGVWDSTGSPYYVTCDVTVPAGETLEIRPGVQVLFTGHYKFNVFGNLQAIGTEQDSIVFTRAFETEESKWWGIRFNDAADDGSRVSYCIVEFAKKEIGNDPDTNGGGLHMERSSPTIDHCTIRNNEGTRGAGICAFEGCDSEILYCLINGNTSPANYFAVWLSIGNARLVNCTVAGNFGGGIWSLTGAFISNSIAWGPENGVGNLTASYCDIQGIGPDNGNIDIDPQFVDAANGEFRLQSNSPCVDAGDPNSPPDPDGTRADMGAFYYPQRLLVVSPSSLDWGLQDIGADSSLTLSLTSISAVSVPILAMNIESSNFTFDSTGLNGAVALNSTFNLPVTFAPTFPGYYEDTLTIVAQSLNVDTIRIPLSGEARIIPLAVDSLVVKKGILNGMQLYWAAVTQTISGQLVMPDYYVVYGATNPEGPFIPVGGGVTNSFLHTFITQSQLKYFYRVTAVVE